MRRPRSRVGGVGLGFVVLMLAACESQAEPVETSRQDSPTSITTVETTTTTTTTTSNSWAEIPASPLARRDGHSIIWTGTEVIVWGGAPSPGGFGPFDPVNPKRGDGAAYDPGTEQWRLIAESPLSQRIWHTAVWTGDEMIVWGGFSDVHEGPQGAAYDPKENLWRSIADPPFSLEQWRHTAVWTGREMIVWGAARSGGALGAAYSPVDDEWRRIAGGPLENRGYHSMTWTGNEMLIWGGIGWDTADALGDGAAYDPANDTWHLLPRSVLEARGGHSAVWTGTELVIWGGRSSQRDVAEKSLSDGASFNPDRGAWTALPASPMEARNDHLSVWTGESMVIWGGHTRTGGSTWRDHDNSAIWESSSNEWTDASASPRATTDTQPGVWVGDRIVAWGASQLGPESVGYQYQPPNSAVAPEAE